MSDAAERIIAADAILGSADQDAWPLTRFERTWSAWKLLITLVTAGAATWCYIIGEYAAFYLNFKQAFAALMAGAMLGMFLTTLAVVPISARFGIDSIAGCKPQFGTRGWALPATLQFFSILGWNSLLVIFFGKSATQFLVTIGVISNAQSSFVVPAATLLACGIIFLVLLRGTAGVDRISKILVAHVFVGLWMLWLLVTRHWHALVTAVPGSASPDPLWNLTTGIEIGVSTSLSWWPYVGAMVRMAPTGRRIAVPSMLGMGATVALLCLIGIAGYLVLQNDDPATWLRTIGGPVYAVIGLLFVTAANLGTSIAGTYCSAIGLRNYKLFAKLPWPALLALTIAPVALVGVIVPDLFFNNFGTFLAFIGVTFAPLCGIQIADYFLLRRGHISIRGIFDLSGKGPYAYWWGVNPAAILGMLAGFGTYIYLLNPLTYTSHEPYEYTSASLPTMLVAATVYTLVTKLLVVRFGRGGYTEG
jgi:nucleobase:cation symporter-1, NCS1 family